jgi:tRNA dimethylallyltransferase
MSDALAIPPVAEPQSAPLAVVAGATASGKSALALALAREFHGEIISCDSMQVYRGFDTGTAKLPLAERLGIPHHLIDIREPDEIFSAGDFAREATAAIAGITARGRLPVVAGGTGFYLRALLDGLAAGPGRNPAIRERLARATGSALHRYLRRLDPESARRIHANDSNKLIRAIEVCREAATPLSAWHRTRRQPLTGYRTLRIWLRPPRGDLYRRIDARAAAMFDAGLLTEIDRLLEAGIPPSAQPFQAVGYRQGLAARNGEMPPGEAIARTQQATRNYAKRQETWFRREPWSVIYAGFGTDPVVARAASAAVRQFLAGSFGELPEKRGEGAP